MTPVRYLRGRLGDLRIWLWVTFGRIPADRIVYGEPMEPAGDHVASLLGHTHVWDRCRWNGQYYYARCVAYEWCTARIAC